MFYVANIGGVTPITSNPNKEALISLGKTINFIYNWLQYFEVNYENKINIHQIKMSELLKKTSKIRVGFNITKKVVD